MTRHFLACIHDATPAYARQTRAMVHDLAPMIGRQLSFGVVPNWHGDWPIAAHPGYCTLLRESAGELLLHGYRHERLLGGGPATLLTQSSDEMNGLTPEQTHDAIERGQRAFVDAFGRPARGFVAPAWQAGHVRPGSAYAPGLDYLFGFFSLEANVGRRIPLATWTWDCGQWGWLGHIGHAGGTLLHSLERVPVLAMHPRDLDRGFWPTILQLTKHLLARGYEPVTPAELVNAQVTA